jgi:hypothetical protein
MASINALAYNMATFITSVFVPVSHFHLSLILGCKARSLLGEAPSLVQKYYTKVEVDSLSKCTGLKYGNINYQCVCHCQPFPPKSNIWEHCLELAQGGFLPCRKILGLSGNRWF